MAQSKKEKKDKGEEESILGGVPTSLPALLRAYRVGQKASNAGFDWPDLKGPNAKVEEEWTDPEPSVVAALSVIYGHEQRQLSQQLTRLQHEDHHAILCSQHVHLSHEDCLEVILMQGTAEQLRRVSDAIVSTRGVKAGKLTLLSANV